MTEGISSPEQQQEEDVDADTTFVMNPRARPVPSFMQDEDEEEQDGEWDGEWDGEQDLGPYWREGEQDEE